MKFHRIRILVALALVACLPLGFGATLNAQPSHSFVGALPLTTQTESIANQRPNVLFISVDDLRPELGCYGNQEIRTLPSAPAVRRTKEVLGLIRSRQTFIGFQPVRAPGLAGDGDEFGV